MAVLLPVDQLLELWPDEFRGIRVGSLLHPASVNSKLEHSARIFERENGRLFHLRALFGPQHGYRGETQDNMIEWRSYEHPRLGIPVYSLYGEHREPTREMLHDLDLLLVDQQDVGLGGALGDQHRRSDGQGPGTDAPGADGLQRHGDLLVCFEKGQPLTASASPGRQRQDRHQQQSARGRAPDGPAADGR